MTLAAGSDTRLFLDEEELSIDGPVFVEKGRVYVPVRLISDFWDEANVSWSQESGQLIVTTRETDRIVFTPGSREVVINGETFWMDAEPMIKNGRIYMPARHMSEVIHAEVYWDREQQSLYFYRVPLYEVQPGETLVDISKKTGVPVEVLKLRNNEDDVYLYAGEEIMTVVPTFMLESPSEEDLELLAKIVHVEAGHESMKGRIAVANVILNRVNDSRFPDSIREVIYQPNQFPPATNGMLDSVSPDEKSYEAALRALQGEVVAEGALYFYNPKRTRSSFFTSRELVIEVGNHRFVK